MIPPLISSFPISERISSSNMGISANMKRKLMLSVSLLLHPLIYVIIFGEFDEILRQSPSERDSGTVRYYAKLCGEWYLILNSYLEKNPSEIRRKLPFSERILWNRIENKYLSEIEWYAECFADILNPDEHTEQNIGIIHSMMKNAAGQR
ncbi:MAG: hypothetical protein BWK80_49785 [Desulfobacteraceae bacterium IS3]|nr:MAG: hypothetical protein BWK80_49785 [Desulfobacteraceae bacterium IS3]